MYVSVLHFAVSAAVQSRGLEHDMTSEAATQNVEIKLEENL